MHVHAHMHVHVLLHMLLHTLTLACMHKYACGCVALLASKLSKHVSASATPCPLLRPLPPWQALPYAPPGIVRYIIQWSAVYWILHWYSLSLLPSIVPMHVQVYARSHSSEATHASFGPIKALAASWWGRVDDDLALFGENMTAVHSIRYDNLASSFYLFGVLSCCRQVRYIQLQCCLRYTLEIMIVICRSCLSRLLPFWDDCVHRMQWSQRNGDHTLDVFWLCS